ncbi:hypothetical protein HKK55_20090 [Pseudomonas sp. ADAK18]|uniref:hypothetical protein n=1 Tax=Pseudomonas sp. ADAK18 TaxID=2730848 RepID=UPI0014637194|nr:hypothetical protein [Pseudomonas sp. ADAK18]QJI30906.1 hypothetical protein HKK55_20090 [Pseudomonas sp. ADAK18]
MPLALSAISPIAPALGPAQETASALNRQLKATTCSPCTGELPLQRDARWIADTVKEKLETLPTTTRDKQEIRALHQTLSIGEQRLEVSPEELPDFYAFFKKAEHIFDGHRSSKKPSIAEDYTFCRALKWQFRAAVSEQEHLRLTQNLLSSLKYIDAGGERINHRHTGYNFPLDPTRLLSAGPHFAVDSHLAYTTDKRLKDTRAMGLLGKLQSRATDLGQTESRLGASYLSSREYENLEDYANANGHSLRASLNENRWGTTTKLRSLIKDSYNLERNRAYSTLSHPFVRESLAANGLGSVELPPLHSKPATVIKEKGIDLSLGNQVSIDFFSYLNFNTTIQLNAQWTQKHKALDILGLSDTAPSSALKKLNTLKYPDDDPVSLLNDMKYHVISSSRRFSHQASTPVLASALNTTLHANNQQARTLLERYVLLKAQHGVEKTVDHEIRMLIRQHSTQLRPEALKKYSMTSPAHTVRGTVSANFSTTTDSAKGKGVTVELIHRKEDDPHLSGDYLEFKIAQFKSIDVVRKTLRELLSSIGKQDFSWDDVIHSISQSLLDHPKRSFSNVLVKVKDHQPVVLLTTHTVNKDSALKLPDFASIASGFEAQSLRTKQYLHKEQIGPDSLDYLLPIARRYLTSLEGSHSWDNYVDAHASDFQALLDNIARQAPGSVLAAELGALTRSSPTLARTVDTLIEHAQTALDAPTPANRALAKAALKNLLEEYLPPYNAKVSEAWTLS